MDANRSLRIIAFFQLAVFTGLQCMTLSSRIGQLSRALASQHSLLAEPSQSIALSKIQWPTSAISRAQYATLTHVPHDSVSDTQDGFVQDEMWHENYYNVRYAYRTAPSSSDEDVPQSLSTVSDIYPIVQQQEKASRIDDGSEFPKRIIPGSWHEYEPEEYESLTSLQKKLISESDYNALKQEYRRLSDVRMYTFTYLVDDQPVLGFALLPTKRPAVGKYPLVLALRGGFNGEGPFREWAKTDLPYIMRHFAFYAQHGYAVLSSQYRGADGNTNKDQFGGDDVHDVLALFDVARQMGNIDMDNIALSVFSRGTVMGYKTLAALKDRTPIKAMVVKGGISDLTTFVHEDPKYIVPILEQARPDFNEHKDEIMRDISLIDHVDVLKNIPTLLMHNEKDNVVPVQLTENLARRLQEEGIEHETHYFPGKHHQMLEYNDRVQDLTIEWLDKHMKKAPFGE
jgi:acetyl esterase/lipase